MLGAPWLKDNRWASLCDKMAEIFFKKKHPEIFTDRKQNYVQLIVNHDKLLR